MSKTSRKFQWNVQKLVDTLKYYLNSQFDEEKDVACLGDIRSFTLLDNDEVLERLKNLIKWNPMLESYGPAESLLENLQRFQYFPNNYQLLRISENLKYHSDTLPYFYTKSEYLPKSEVHQKIVETLVKTASCCQNNRQFDRLLAISFANRCQRQSLANFELIPLFYVDHSLKMMAGTHMYGAKSKWESRKRLKIDKKIVELLDVFESLAQYFDEKNDEDLIVELWKRLTLFDEKHPISENLKDYQAIIERFDEMNYISKNLAILHPMCIQPIERVKKVPAGVAMGLRYFLDDEIPRFMLAKDVEIALNIDLRLKNEKPVKAGFVPIESPEERKLGIVKTMSEKEVEDIYQKAGLILKKSSTTCLVVEPIRRSSDDITTPTISYYSTHIKPAFDTFTELFEDVAVKLRLFETAKSEDLEKIIEYFENIDIFDSTQEKLYFIEIVEVAKRRSEALEYLGKFVTEPVLHHPTNISDTLDETKIAEEIQKMSRTLSIDTTLLESTIFQFRKSKKLQEFLPGHLTRILAKCARIEILKKSAKLSQFMRAQGREETFYETCEESDENSEPAKIEVLDVVGWKKPSDDTSDENSPKTAVERRLVDEASVYKKCTERILEHTKKEDVDLTKLILETKKPNIPSTITIEETEAEKICAQFYEKFEAVEPQTSINFDKKKGFKFDSIWKKLASDDLKISKHPDFPSKVRKAAEQCWSRRCVDDKSKPPIAHFSDVLAHCARLKWACEAENYNAVVEVVLRHITPIRMLRETRGEGDWHMFGEEIVEILKGILKKEKQWTMEKKDRLEKWERSWYSSLSPVTINITEFNEIVAYLKIVNRRFTLIPDMKLSRKLFELPLQTCDSALIVDGPSEEEVLHQCQAQLFIFEKLISENGHRCKEWFDEVLEMMKKIQPGYTLAYEVGEMVEQAQWAALPDKYIPPIVDSKKKSDLNELGEVRKKRWENLIDEVFKSRENEIELKSNLLRALKVVILDDFEDYAKFENYVKMYAPPECTKKENVVEKSCELCRKLQAAQDRRLLLNMETETRFFKDEVLLQTFRKLYGIVGHTISCQKFEPVKNFESTMDYPRLCFPSSDYARLFEMLCDPAEIETLKKKFYNVLEFDINKEGEVVFRRYAGEAEKNRKREEIMKKLEAKRKELADNAEKGLDEEGKDVPERLGSNKTKTLLKSAKPNSKDTKIAELRNAIDENEKRIQMALKHVETLVTSQDKIMKLQNAMETVDQQAESLEMFEELTTEFEKLIRCSEDLGESSDNIKKLRESVEEARKNQNSLKAKIAKQLSQKPVVKAPEFVKPTGKPSESVNSKPPEISKKSQESHSSKAPEAAKSTGKSSESNNFKAPEVTQSSSKPVEVKKAATAKNTLQKAPESPKPPSESAEKPNKYTKSAKMLRELDDLSSSVEGLLGFTKKLKAGDGYNRLQKMIDTEKRKVKILSRKNRTAPEVAPEVEKVQDAAPEEVKLTKKSRKRVRKVSEGVELETSRSPEVVFHFEVGIPELLCGERHTMTPKRVEFRSPIRGEFEEDDEEPSEPQVNVHVQECRKVSEDSGVGEIGETKKLRNCQKKLVDSDKNCKHLEQLVKDLEYENNILKKNAQDHQKSTKSTISNLKIDLKRKEGRIDELLQELQNDRAQKEIEIEKMKNHYETMLASMETEKSRKDGEIKKMTLALEKQKSRNEELQRDAEKKAETEAAKELADAEKLEIEEEKNLKLRYLNSKMEKKLEEEKLIRLTMAQRNDELLFESRFLREENEGYERKIQKIRTCTNINLTLFDIENDVDQNDSCTWIPPPAMSPSCSEPQQQQQQPVLLMPQLVRCYCAYPPPIDYNCPPPPPRYPHHPQTMGRRYGRNPPRMNKRNFPPLPR